MIPSLNVGGAPASLDVEFTEVPDAWDGTNAGGAPAGLEAGEFAPPPDQTVPSWGLTWLGWQAQPLTELPRLKQLTYDASGQELVASHDLTAEYYLAKIRTAILNYRVLNGVFPAADGLDATLKSHLGSSGGLRGAFPICPVGPAQNTAVRMLADNELVLGESDPTKGWAYKKLTGELIVNFTGPSKLDPNIHYDQF